MSRSAKNVILEHASFVWRALLHLGVREDQLEDASQEVFVVVLRRYAQFEGRSSVRTWLFGICRNVALATRRRVRDRREVPSADLPDSVVQPAQEGELWIKRAHQRLLECLDELDDDQRTVFVLYEIEELPMEEIARSLGAPVTTCYSRLYAAREAVQAGLRRRERFTNPVRKEISQ